MLVTILVAAFVVRMVGIRHGLPFAYNPDEELHFVPHAANAADGDLNPGYYENPSALTYLLAAVFKVVFLGSDVSTRLADDPATVYTVARVVVAVLGTVLVWLVHWTATRFFDRTTALVAAAVTAFAFLPVFYSHQALNDVVTLLPVTVALAGSLLAYERGGWRMFVLAGGAVGVAVGTKYLAAPMACVVALAAVLRVVERKERVAPVIGLLCASGVACLVGLFALNPYLLLDFGVFVDQFGGQSSQVATAKLGQQGNAWTYYPGTLLWGFGLLPLAFALGGFAVLLRRNRAHALMLVGFPVLLYLYLATQDRFFARWVLPAYPALAVLAGLGVTIAGERIRDRLSAGRGRVARLGVVALPALAVIVLAQPLADAVRSDLVLSRTDTRTAARGWILDEIPRADRVVLEPSFPASYLDESTLELYPVERPYQAYEARLSPDLLDGYRANGFCWVVVTSHQKDRGLSADLPGARSYYRRLDDESSLEAVFSPYRAGAEAPAFSFDFSFDWYPPAYARPGPLVEVRHLADCRR
ncbi:hypothetical protein D0Z08_12165 [Nocardioides immobilis]|uniref:Glycosyltransferase RgtA/B/C/D-like domain-containing protein n=1 Tax=Nocardioides immobilis TaxID=2049295 RepID=A0A417Y2W6_9ACTN|nr:glycosyltransferase family 39 protein [Nocardioides immobilis]RHW26931.1 hypothetical protein D0Z08_12165 [Nocardioides immobilis]